MFIIGQAEANNQTWFQILSFKIETQLNMLQFILELNETKLDQTQNLMADGQ